MITQQDQKRFFAELELDMTKVTDFNEREKAKQELRSAGQMNPQNAARFDQTPFEITDLESVKKAWKKKCMSYHPDKFNQEAYQNYIDALKRSRDKVEECEEDVVISKEEMEDMFRRVTHAYKMLIDPSYADKYKKDCNGGQARLDAVFNVTVDFEQAFFGDSIAITFNPLHIDDSGKPVKINEEKDAYLIEGEVIQIRIREGVSTGDRITIPSRGLCQGDRRGDMIITLQVVPHPRFRTQGSDIMDTALVPLDMMLTGGEMQISTMWGVETLRIPAGTRPKEQLKIKKRGVAKIGDHIVVVEPLYPEKEELKSSKIWKKLRINWNKEEEKNDKEAKEEQEYQTIFNNLGGFTFTGSSSGTTTSVRWT